MSRYVMVADLRRCVGCQTCTAACKLANATPPGVQWRRVVDIESGEYPDVRRTFLPLSCQHCSNPPCVEVCPTGASWQRADGIVAIDYDRCIGCAYCFMACPYQVRYKVEKLTYAYDGIPMDSELAALDRRRVGVVSKCNFCQDRIDAGRAQGLIPGKDPEATPVCVNSCIANALCFGDIEDPDSEVSRLLRENESFRLHEELGTEPGFYYLVERREVKAR
jgi:phenylacetyl-CoA:acceptor oxidoreductase subunit 1